jgi:CubicO group peptidase (beta-lactamase class C family)
MTRRRRATPYVDSVRALDARTPRIDAFVDEMLASGRTSTLQCAVRRGGELAVSVAGGWRQDCGHVTRASLFHGLSCTKFFTSLAMLMLHDRGCYRFDDRVADHWPAFAAHGKQDITIRQVLTHRAGVRLGPPGTSWGWWGDREQVGRELALLSPEWEPGTRQGYHNRIWGFLLDQLAWRWTGAGIDGLLRDHVAGPIGVDDFFLGIDRENYGRLVRLEPPRRPAAAASAGAGTGAVDAASARRDVQVANDAEFRPRIGDEDNMFNAYELMRLPLAWGFAIYTAEAATDIASFLAGGGVHRGLRLVSASTFAEATRNHSRENEPDLTLGAPTRWGLGLQLDLFPDLAPGVFGHGGGSTAHVWADPGRGIAAACQVGTNPESPRAALAWRRAFAEAVYGDFG